MQIFDCTGIHAPKRSVVYTTMNAHIRSLGQGQVVITYGDKNVGSSCPIPLFRATQRTCFITILKFASIMLLARSLQLCELKKYLVTHIIDAMNLLYINHSSDQVQVDFLYFPKRLGERMTFVIAMLKPQHVLESPENLTPVTVPPGGSLIPSIRDQAQELAFLKSPQVRHWSREGTCRNTELQCF